VRRWNGWGEEGREVPLAPEGAALLAQRLGEGDRSADASLADVVGGVRASRLPHHPLVEVDGEVRARHARGQSLPDWIALRSGRLGATPDGVAFPQTREEVRRLLSYAQQVGARVVPYGGGTSVVGHLTPVAAGAPVLTVSLARLRRLTAFDARSGLATFGAGVPGPELESELRTRGFTLGHYPQSFELSTLGGWVVTRSSGQQSLAYGRIERLFAGGVVETPQGSLELPAHPASAAGPDLRELVLGSEGRLGVLTEATVRAVPLPEREEFEACAFADWASGEAALRALVQARVPLSMLRLSSAEETATAFALSGHPRLTAALRAWLRLRGAGPRPCLLLLGATGRQRMVEAALRDARTVCASWGGAWLGAGPGRTWRQSRFRAPYLRNTLWERGLAVDTLETAVSWARLATLQRAIESAIRDQAGRHGERAHVFTHVSHAYADGASLYTTFLFRRHPDPEATLARWRDMKVAASEAIVAARATISHQHGVGRDHRRWLAAEKGALGSTLLRSAFTCVDPGALMNPGALLEPSST
jgi:alkyldihydroxyacetonephosphate synthase